MRKRIWQWAGLLTAALMLALAWALPIPVQAADTGYADNHLSDYGIPDAVTEVLMANSRYANGESPAQRGQTPATFTIGDVEQLLTVSLADVTYKGDGTIATSTPDPTVAAWIASAKAAGYGAAAAVPTYDIAQNAYSLNSAGQVETVLANKAMSVDGRNNEQPAVNFLFQIIASASSAAIVDLDGVTSQVGDTITAQAIMALFQTDRLPKLETLIISNDNLGNLQYIMYGLQEHPSLFAVTSAQRVTTLDMSNNDITSFPAGGAFTIGQYLTELNFDGNPTTQITDSMSNMLVQLILRNGGIGKLDSFDPSSADYNTVHSLVALMNAATGTLSINAGTVNVIMQAVPKLVSPEAVTRYWDSLNTATAKVLYDAATNPNSWEWNPLLKDDPKLVEKLGALVHHTEDMLTVSESLQFAPITLGAMTGSFPSQSAFSLSTTLNPGAAIFASISAWRKQDDSSAPSFVGDVTFKPNALVASSTTITGKAQRFYINSTTGVQKDLTASFPQGNVTLAIDPSQRAQLRPGEYQATIQWTIQDSQTGN